jgi:TRAP-type C4-dicarboxylate transport system permease small subunit
MKKAIEFYDKIEGSLLVYSLILNVTLMFFQVCMRSVFNLSPSWTEEMARYIFIWQTWLGTSLALREDKHIRITVINNVIKSERGIRIINAMGIILWLVTSLFLLQSGTKLVISLINRQVLSSGMRIPLSFVYAALPFSSLVTICRLVGKLYSISGLGMSEGGHS